MAEIVNDYTDSKGLKIYYSKIKSGIVIIIFATTFIAHLIFSIVEHHGILALLSIIYLFYFFKGLKYFVFTKPIFIYNNGTLLCTKYNINYNYQNYVFEIEIVGRHNYSQSLRIYDLKGEIQLTENLWYIKDNWEIDDIVKKMKLLKLLKLKNELQTK